MRFRCCVAAAVWIGLILASFPMCSAARLALVVGNSHYQHAPLVNPRNDARDIQQALEGVGFQVILREDLNRRGLITAINQFSAKLAQQGGVGLFYYAGHGVEIDGVNYILPIGADIQNEADIEFEALNVRRLLRNMEQARNRLNLVIIDACRNNPFSHSFGRTIRTRGLGRMSAPIDSLIASSTASGQIAADGAYGRNSPYTQQLLKFINQPGLSVEHLFKEVRKGVLKETNNRQRPWEISLLTQDFYFVEPDKPEKAVLAVKPTPAEARVRIMNTVQAYRVGIELEPDDYDIEVSHPGYVTHRQVYSLDAGDQVLVIELEPVASVASVVAEPESPNRSLNPEMVTIPGGCYQMGSPESEEGRDDDERQHRVCVDDFQIGRYEVTVAEYRRFVESTGYKTEAERHVEWEGCWASGAGDYTWKWHAGVSWRNPNPNHAHQETHPVSCVSWNDAQAYLEWLSKETGLAYRLPTEAEWEYAARAGTTRARYWGEDADEACRYANVGDKTKGPDNISWDEAHNCQDEYFFVAPVGRYQANPWQLYDMLGNVWEWTCSSYESGYDGTEGRCLGKNNANNSALLVLRGGSWTHRPRGVRSANRGWNAPSFRDTALGFPSCQVITLCSLIFYPFLFPRAAR